jgi:hypothetical protein
MTLEPTDYELLRSLGFEKIGHWKINKDDDDLLIPCFDKTSVVNEYRTKPALYAFMSDDKRTKEKIVRYIGKVECSDKPLEDRLTNYKNIHPDKKKSHAKRGRLIRDLLKTNHEVLIFAHVPKEEKTYRGIIDINLIDGLEYPIAQKFKERNGNEMWNKRCVKIPEKNF